MTAQPEDVFAAVAATRARQRARAEEERMRRAASVRGLIRDLALVIACGGALAWLLLSLMGCTLSTGDMIVAPSQTQTVTLGGDGKPTSSPSPAASGTCVRLAVGIVSQTCTSGTPGSGTAIPVGCSAFATATPKLATGEDAPEAIHGWAVSWTVDPAVGGGGCVQLRSHGDGSNPYNRDVVAMASSCPYAINVSVTGPACNVSGSLTGTTAPATGSW